MTIIAHPGYSRLLNKEIVYLRRYARALTGSRKIGDLITQEIRALIEKTPLKSNIRVSLFEKFHSTWPKLSPVELCSGLPSMSREVFLLHSLEGFSFDEISSILKMPVPSVQRLHEEAVADLEKMRPSRILMVEDEALIAMDMANVVSGLGHTVVGVARTHAEAVSLVKKKAPDLITCDIRLADGSSGIEAIEEIHSFAPDIPVVFLTGFPEDLLTGSRSEPAFVIDKPYREKQVISAITQALELNSKTAV